MKSRGFLKKSGTYTSSPSGLPEPTQSAPCPAGAAPRRAGRARLTGGTFATAPRRRAGGRRSGLRLRRRAAGPRGRRGVRAAAPTFRPRRRPSVRRRPPLNYTHVYSPTRPRRGPLRCAPAERSRERPAPFPLWVRNWGRGAWEDGDAGFGTREVGVRILLLGSCYEASIIPNWKPKTHPPPPNFFIPFGL